MQIHRGARRPQPDRQSNPKLALARAIAAFYAKPYESLGVSQDPAPGMVPPSEATARFTSGYDRQKQPYRGDRVTPPGRVVIGDNVTMETGQRSFPTSRSTMTPLSAHDAASTAER
ncbi:MAG: hypothetical protein IPJ07_23545 [Acidobacteria bacterium]|nr:hypothetical protein [Acidobacteriota bacterium]